MKKLTYRLVAIVAVSTLGLNGCKKEKKPEPERKLETLVVNFYKPATTGEEKDVPQLTLKNNEVQITAIGNNSNGVQQSIKRVYISDTEAKTEWIVLLDDNSKPSFLYAINSTTKEKLPDLYWIQYKDATTDILRHYDYDWNNRLGTLKYEVELKGNQVNVIFKSEVVQADRISTVSGNPRKVKASKSFPAPVLAFNRINNPQAGENTIRNDESLDEQFDSSLMDLMNILKETKTKLINAPCNVSKVLNRANNNFICQLSDQLNKVTDEKFFDDLSTASQADQQETGSEYEGDNIKFDIDFFNASDIIGDIARHINDLRNDIGSSTNFSNWFSNLVEYTTTRSDDLNDLSDRNGVIHIALGWNTTSDIDLHVTDPFGEKIFFDHATSNSGGYLDRDDVDGFGPENIYWMGNGPDGTYKVEVHYYDPSDGPSTQFNVKVINGLGFSKFYQGTLSGQDDMQTVVIFTKSGTSITVQ